MNTTSNIYHQAIANNIRYIENEWPRRLIQITFLSLSNGTREQMLLRQMQLTDPNFITFVGKVNLEDIRITQHISQVSFSISTLPCYDPNPVKQIEFI